MFDGAYEVISDIHVYDCCFGQLKIPKGKIVKIEGAYGYADSAKFPVELLNHCETKFKKTRR